MILLVNTGSLIPAIKFLIIPIFMVIVLVSVTLVAQSFIRRGDSHSSYSSSSPIKENKKPTTYHSLTNKAPELKAETKSCACQYCNTVLTTKMRERYSNCPNCGAPLN